MITRKNFVCLIFPMFALVIYSLFTIKNNVITIKAELNQVNKQIQHEMDSIHLLKAELAYLTSPERLEKLNKNYMKLKETKLAQLITDPLKAENDISNRKIANAKKRNNVTWRYKKGPTKYLTMVSKKSKIKKQF